MHVILIYSIKIRSVAGICFNIINIFYMICNYFYMSNYKFLRRPIKKILLTKMLNTSNKNEIKTILTIAADSVKYTSLLCSSVMGQGLITI